MDYERPSGQTPLRLPWRQETNRASRLRRTSEVNITMTEEFVKVASISEVPLDKMKLVQYKGQPVCIANSKGKYYAIRNTCTHLGGPLAQGKLEDQTVECPWHGSRFDLTTGEVRRGPAQIPEKVYEVKIEGSSILVRPK
jgi:nitrite reductase/ring-hydroxylating ferredoxin subunit